MNWFELILAILIGIIQGVSEFLPVSSTAHQAIVSSIFTSGYAISIEQSNLIQLATLVAIIQFFWKDLKRYALRLRTIFSSTDSIQQFFSAGIQWVTNPYSSTITKQEQTDRDMYQIALGTLPIILLGYYLRGLAGTYRNLSAIAVFLILGSCMMIGAELIAKSRTSFNAKPLSPADVFFIGIFQSLAALPGMSRSGSTISGALLIGRPRAEAVRFSFLLAVPALILASLYDIFQSLLSLNFGGITLLPQDAYNFTGGVFSLSIASLILACVAAYFSGYISLKWLIKYLSSNTFYPFAAYRIILATSLLILLGIEIL